MWFWWWVVSNMMCCIQSCLQLGIFGRPLPSTRNSFGSRSFTVPSSLLGKKKNKTPIYFSLLQFWDLYASPLDLFISQKFNPFLLSAWTCNLLRKKAWYVRVFNNGCNICDGIAGVQRSFLPFISFQLFLLCDC